MTEYSYFAILAAKLNISTLSELATFSFEQVCDTVGDAVPFAECQALYETANTRYAESNSRLRHNITHGNPQLRQVTLLGASSATTRAAVPEYSNNFFPDRSEAYVKEGDISSMFSPAAYLTELYSESCYLHEPHSPLHLNKRRPDLATLRLSQVNRDAAVSTLSLSNNILQIAIREIFELKSEREVYKALAGNQTLPDGPYHHPFAGVKESLSVRKIMLQSLLKPEYRPKNTNDDALLCTDLGISPTAYLWLKNGKVATEKKLARLQILTGLTPYTLSQILEHANHVFDSDILKSLNRILNYQAHYKLSEEQALMFIQPNISTKCLGADQPSQFDRLFNAPPLNGETFTFSGESISLAPTETSVAKSVLMRALDVNDTELYQLFNIVAPSHDRFTIENKNQDISVLYCLRLIATAHALSIAELAKLLIVLPPYDKELELTVQLNEILEAVSRIASWLRQCGLTITDLFVMTTETFDTTQTQELNNLINNLKNGISEPVAITGNVTVLTGDDLKQAMAPHLSSALGLTSADTARLLLIWLDSSSYKRLSIDHFWQSVRVLDADDNFTIPPDAIVVCHQLAQLAYIVQRLGLNERELDLLVNAPEKLNGNKIIYLRQVDTLIQLSRFHLWVNALGDQSSTLLTSLHNGSLSVRQLASAMRLDYLALENTANIALSSSTILPDAAAIERLLQWYQACQTLGVTADILRQLFTWKQTALTLESISTALQSTLTTAQHSSVVKSLDTQLSAALCQLYLSSNLARQLGLNSRDDLFAFLLIDNQIGAEVMTSPIASAIAGIQLYVSRCLHEPNKEHGILDAALSRPFIKNWETYNKRYSTWAGIAQLSYFPENYLDATQRIGQTEMIGNLLQSIAQSQLTPDSVEEAFKCYLTEFEKVANLKVISGYHDHLDINEGKTYLVGQSQENPPAYYWRSVDHNETTEGVFPANAWSEWKVITASAMPHNNLIRPVVFKSRLYLLWIERRQIKRREQDSLNNADTWAFDLKLSFLRYDGSWSAPLSFDTQITPKDALLYAALNDEASSSRVDLFCTNAIDTDRLRVLLFLKKTLMTEYNHEAMENQMLYWSINASLEIRSELQVPLDIVSHELDTLTVRKVANSFSQQLTVSPSAKPVAGNISGAKLSDISITPNDGIEHGYTLAGKMSLPMQNNEGFYWVEFSNIGAFKITPGLDDYNFTVTPMSGDFSHYPFITISAGPELKLVFSFIFAGNTFTPLYSRTLAEVLAPGNLFYFSATNGPSGPCAIKPAEWPQSERPVIKITNGVINGEEIPLSLNEVNDTHSQIGWSCKVPFFPEADRLALTFWVSKTFLGTTLKSCFTIPLLSKKALPENVLQLFTTAENAQYMQWGGENRVNRVRLNTLFAQELLSRANRGLDAILSFDSQTLPEPPLPGQHEGIMDFSGANALYFWELFYYTPMLVAQRLLQEQQFAQAARWLSFVFNPAGYDGDRHRIWNTRPLLEDTKWSEVPQDNTDPDSVAQTDPMHYKVATLMRQLELLIARGDHAYRQLERDTLVEAKMWYLQALGLMGKDTHTEPSPWANPALSDAAHTANAEVRALESYQAIPMQRVSVQSYTTDIVTRLFNPQQNTHWQDLRGNLERRLFNLRHNLTLDGQPLSLPLFTVPADPAELFSATISASQKGTPLPQESIIGLQRFPQALESARSLTTQLTQFGSTLLGVIERQDAEQMAVLMQNQGRELINQSLDIQQKNLDELKEETKLLITSLAGAEKRYTYYKSLCDQNISAAEQHVMNMHNSINGIQTVSHPLMMAGAISQLAPNIFGLADGGSNWGSVPTAIGMGIQFSVEITQAVAEGISQSEGYRRRLEEWHMLRDNADNEVQQIKAQQSALVRRTEAATLQQAYLELQQGQQKAQFDLMQSKFSNGKLFNWMRGRLSALYFQFYDLAVSRCLRAEASFIWETLQKRHFIKPGAWQGTYAGLLCGEVLLLNLSAMETAYQNWQQRALEVDRTISLAQFYQSQEKGGFELRNAVASALQKVNTGNGSNGVELQGSTLAVSVKLSDLNLQDDYTTDLQLGSVRRIKQISVTLPALLGPYQNVQAILSYTGTLNLPKGCSSIAVSRGMNDSGQFQLDFNDNHYLPFEGVDIGDTGLLVLRFPNATGKQEALLRSLSDIILHLRYTIRD